MEKLKKIYKIALIGLLAAWILSGCGEKKDAKELMEEAASKMETVVSVGGNMAFDVAMNVSGDVDGSVMDMDMSLNMDVDMQITNAPEASHLKGSLTSNVLGMNSTVEVENYTIKSDDNVVGYTYTNDQWYKQTAGSSDFTAFADSSFFKSLSDENIKLVLEKDLAEEDGEKYYVVRTTINGEDYIRLMGDSEDMMGSLIDYEAVDVSKLSVDTEIHINKETKLPYRILFDLSQSMDAFATSMDAGMSMEMKTFQVSVRYDSFNEVTEISVPQDVVDSALDGDAKDSGTSDENEESYNPYEEDDYDPSDTMNMTDDGQVVIGDGNHEVSVLPAEGYMIDHGEKNFVSLTNGQNASVEYRVETISKDAAEKLLEDYKGVLEKTEGYSNFELSDMETEALNGMEVSYRTLTYDGMDFKEMKGYCWTELGDGIYLTVGISDYAFEDESFSVEIPGTINTLFESVKK